MTDELTFLRELERLIQRVHRATPPKCISTVEYILLAKKLINDRIIAVLEERTTVKLCSALQGSTAFGVRATCTLPRGHGSFHKWSTA